MKIAIDGPAGAGKSTIARRVASALGYVYIDTGAMYRALTLAVLQKKADPKCEQQVEQIASSLNLRLRPDRRGGGNRVLIGRKDVTLRIREPEVTENVSLVSSYPSVRQKMVEMQQQIAESGDVVMDGRDIGTTVMPDAEVKIFLKASIRERARRRSLELIRKGYQVNLAELEEQLRTRDIFDSTRKVSPLRKAEDAVVIDTTSMSVDEVVAEVLSVCRGREIHV